MDKKELSQEMEDKIMQAAIKVFVLKGRAGTSMQDIAEEAGVNRTLVNYYFRSKENLFEQVFMKIFSKFFTEVAGVLNSDAPVEEKLNDFIEHYYTMLIENPIIPLFIMQELTTNPDRLVGLFKGGGINISKILSSFEIEMKSGTIRKTDPRELFINLMSQIIFPFIARPLITEIIFAGEKNAYNEFLLRRKEAIKESFYKSLKP
ncbi:MAG: TetR/AcrR family transcriptional regulator [Bacteroidales bacterium]|nr:TetR/AcrR family transcriptional regulator [Bacteroidales bacterium]MCB8998867.1 TetR/AcrR family transcriptional regulator [Bacteroidales bacterium]MCB9013994.1 TetR/AcrR family transcriptional regulator [Bacteroidales bacterium]